MRCTAAVSAARKVRGLKRGDSASKGAFTNGNLISDAVSAAYARY